jgi:F-type H+-transporting ATPase subunit gamma
MASLRQIRQRMKSIHNIHEITKAMGMIAAFRFKKAEGRFSRSRAYFLEMEKLVANLAASASEREDPLFGGRAVKKKALVVMTGDKGLCGAYNTNLARAAAAWQRENASFETALVPVGKIGAETFRKRHLKTLLTYPERSAVDFSFAKKMADELKAAYLSGATDSVELLYTTFRVGGAGAPKVTPYLGLAYLVEGKKETATATDYLYEPDFEGVFRPLLGAYLEGKLYMALLESLTSEYAARMAAMNQATDNSEEILDSLKLLRNKTRQATITRELSEIVGGAAVLV